MRGGPGAAEGNNNGGALASMNCAACEEIKRKRLTASPALLLCWLNSQILFAKRCARPFSCLTILGDAFRRKRFQGLILRVCSGKVQGSKAEGLP